jgi:hypothetical protein
MPNVEVVKFIDATRKVYPFRHEYLDIFPIIGDMNNIVNSPILTSKVVTNNHDNIMHTLIISTIKGSVQFKWIGEIKYKLIENKA